MTARLGAFTVWACFIGAVIALGQPSVPPTTPEQPVAVMTSPPPQSPRPLTRDDAEAWLDGFMPYALERNDIAGGVVVIVRDGQTLSQRGYGYADVEKRTAIDPATTLFRPGSVSKLFTWTALMQLVEQGKVGLDADINRYLDFVIPPRDGRPITVRNLLTHTPGFEETIKDLIRFSDEKVPPLGDLLKRWVPARIFPPGEIPAYSNYGAALGGYIVQRVSGQSFDDYVEQNIFGPLDMQHATFRQPLPAPFKPLMSSGYDLGSGTAKPYEIIGLAPAGSAAIAAGDMAHFMIAHLQDGVYEGRAMLEPATARMMHGTVLTTINPALHRMALGFYEENRNGHRIIGHGGDTVWFHSYLHLFPDDNVGLFVSLNSAGKDGASLALREEMLRQFADRYFPGPALTGQTDPATARADAARMAGTYEASRRSETNFLSLLNLFQSARVSADDEGRISVSAIKGPDGVARRFTEIQPLLWRDVDGQTLLAAKPDGDGIAMWAEGGTSPFQVFLRTPGNRDATWLLPAMGASVAALLLTSLLWPITAIVRWRYAAPFRHRGWQGHCYRLTRAAALAAGLLMSVWLAAEVLMLRYYVVTAAMDPWIETLHVASIIIFPLAALVALANVLTVFRNRTGWRSWFARSWSVVLLIATSLLLWIGVAFHLVGMGANY